MISLYRRRKPWIIAAAVIILIYAVFLVSSYRSGDLGFFRDARLLEVNICLSDTEYSPVTKVPLDTKTIYLCGKVDGTTNLGVAKYVFYGDKAIDNESLNLLSLEPRCVIEITGHF